MKPTRKYDPLNSLQLHCLQPYYSNKLLKCVIVKIHSDTKPQKFDASYKRKSKLSRQINQVGSAKSDQSDSFS